MFYNKTNGAYITNSSIQDFNFVGSTCEVLQPIKIKLYGCKGLIIYVLGLKHFKFGLLFNKLWLILCLGAKL